MGRYLSEGIQRDLAKGLRVGLIAFTRTGSRAVFESVADAMKGEAKSISKANGAERITSNEGGVFRTFAHTQGGLSGETLDVLIIIDRAKYSLDQIQSIKREALPLGDTRPNFELIIQ